MCSECACKLPGSPAPESVDPSPVLPVPGGDRVLLGRRCFHSAETIVQRVFHVGIIFKRGSQMQGQLFVRSTFFLWHWNVHTFDFGVEAIKRVCSRIRQQLAVVRSAPSEFGLLLLLQGDFNICDSGRERTLTSRNAPSTCGPAIRQSRPLAPSLRSCISAVSATTPPSPAAPALLLSSCSPHSLPPFGCSCGISSAVGASGHAHIRIARAV